MIDFVKLGKFKEVLYFAHTDSESEKILALRDLTNQYVQDYEKEQLRMQRALATQELRGENPSPVPIHLPRDYYGEQVSIQFGQNEEKSIFQQSQDSSDTTDFGL